MPPSFFFAEEWIIDPEKDILLLLDKQKRIHIINLVNLANYGQEEGVTMTTVSMFEAKTNLSKYVSSITDRREPYVVILRNGKPVAKIVPFEEDTSKRIGLAEGRIPYLSSLEDFNSIDIEPEMTGGGLL